MPRPDESIRHADETYYRADVVGLLCRALFALGALCGAVAFYAARRFVFSD